MSGEQRFDLILETSLPLFQQNGAELFKGTGLLLQRLLGGFFRFAEGKERPDVPDRFRDAGAML